MIEFAISIAIAMLVYWLLILRPGRFNFWRLVAKYPDVAYDHFKTDNCWRIFEHRLPKNYRETVPKSEWAGPFRVTVPKLGDKLVYVFGRRSDYSPSQDEFLNRLGRST